MLLQEIEALAQIGERGGHILVEDLEVALVDVDTFCDQHGSSSG